jgi:crossover junction endodeoxyribonuclease RusA
VTGVLFIVAGVPAPQGSKTRTKWGVREDNPATRPWRTAVTWEATAAMQGRDPLTGPVLLHVTFHFPRPRSHYGTGRNADRLKESSPSFHATKPDADKLLRAIGDAITGVVVRDDCQLAQVVAVKRYGVPHAEVHVAPLDGEMTA